MTTSARTSCRMREAIRRWRHSDFSPPYSPDLNPIEMAFAKSRRSTTQVRFEPWMPLWKTPEALSTAFTQGSCQLLSAVVRHPRCSAVTWRISIAAVLVSSGTVGPGSLRRRVFRPTDVFERSTSRPIRPVGTLPQVKRGRLGEVARCKWFAAAQRNQIDERPWVALYPSSAKVRLAADQ